MHQSIIESPDTNRKLNDSGLSELRPRALTFTRSPDSSFEESRIVSPIKRIGIASPSPPHRQIRQLRLFDVPSTPNTIIQKSAFGKLKPSRIGTPGNFFRHGLDDSDRRSSHQLHNRLLEIVSTKANVNPYTPDSQRMQNKKRSRTEAQQENIANVENENNVVSRRSLPSLFTNYLEIDQCFEEHAPKRLALEETSISRYRREFVEQSLIGTGEFGKVYQCLNRLDGCTYAIKKSIKPVAGSVYEKTALNEVWAHAVLGKHDNVVRYYSAWAENDHMLIQNEYCNGGSLQTVLETRCLDESELRILLTHIARGLQYIHSHDLCHMDIKSGNIFLSRVPRRTVCYNNLNYMEDVYENEKDNDDAEDLVIYKIGDLGHVTSVKESPIEDGDCRYLPTEVLNDDYRHLFKADMFALGMTLYEAGGGGPLPKNGEEWLKLRAGTIPNLPCLTKSFNNLIKQLMHPNPIERPSSTTIFRHPVLLSSDMVRSMSAMTRDELMSKSKSQLTEELIKERERNRILAEKLFSLQPSPRNLKRASPMATDRKLRSTTKSRASRNRDSNKNIYGNFGGYSR